MLREVIECVLFTLKLGGLCCLPPGCLVAHAVSRQCFVVETPFKYHGSPYGISGGWCSTRTGFFLGTTHSTIASYMILNLCISLCVEISEMKLNNIVQRGQNLICFNVATCFDLMISSGQHI